MAVNVKMGVDIGGFTSGIKEGQNQLKTLKAEMKATEAEFKATGNSEKALADKTKTLTQQIKTQQNIIKQAEAAMKALADAGVKPTDQAYQRLNLQMLQAKTGMNEAQAALNGLSGAQQEAATGADKLTKSMNGISKKISLEQVKSGIDSITTGLENAARKAAQVGQAIWDEIMNSARWADDTATMAQMYGIDIDTFLRMQKLVANGMDTSVEAILTSQSKLERNMAAGSKTVVEAMQAMGLATTEWAQVEGQSGPSVVLKDSTDMFWEAGKAILAMKDAYKQEEYAQALFGRSWHELVPLFTQFKDKESFTEALNSVNVESEDTVTKLAKLNDKIGELEGNFRTLERTVLGELAEPLTKGADALSGMLSKIMEFLETPKGQQMLEDMGTAVSGLFEDLGKIEPDKVVEGFKGVFDSIVGSFQWLVEHKDELSGILTTIVGGWAAAKLTGGALQVLTLINGLRGLSGKAAASAAATGAGATAGTTSGLFSSIAKGAVPNALVAWGILEGFKHIPTGLLNGFTTGIGGNAAVTMQQIQQGAGINTYGDLMNHAVTIQNSTGKNGFQQALGVLFGGSKNSGGGGRHFEIDVDPKVDTQMAQDQLDSKTLSVAVVPQIQWGSGSVWGSGGGGGGSGWKITQRANGLWSVPYDGYLARLHKDEQIVPARAVNNRSYSSNLYVESMYMNNGMDASGLAQAMAAEQRRTSSGYGS